MTDPDETELEEEERKLREKLARPWTLLANAKSEANRRWRRRKLRREQWYANTTPAERNDRYRVQPKMWLGPQYGGMGDEEAGSLAYSDLGLSRIIDQAEALAEVRGNDYVGDQLSGHLALVVPEPDNKWGDPLVHSNVGLDFTRHNPEILRKELAGLLPIEGEHLPRPPKNARSTRAGGNNDVKLPEELTVKQAALVLGVNASAVYQMIYAKRIPATFGKGLRQWSIARSDLEDFQRQWARGSQTPTHPAQPTATGGPTTPTETHEEAHRDEEMPVVEPIARPPILSITDGSLWVRKRGEHAGETVKVKRTNDHSVMFTIEKRGANQGSKSFIGKNQELRQRRDWFLNHYEPATEHEWARAAIPPPPKVEAVPVPAAEAPVRAEELAPTTEYAPSSAAWEIDPNVEPEPLPEPVAVTPTPPQKRRRNATDFADPKEIKDILELWRGGIEVRELARDYNALPAGIYALLDQRIPNEYRLRRALDVVKRQGGGPIKQYVISQQTGFNAKECESILSYGQHLGVVVRWEERPPGQRAITTWVALPENAPKAVTPTPVVPEPDASYRQGGETFSLGPKDTEPEPIVVAPIPEPEPTVEVVEVPMAQPAEAPAPIARPFAVGSKRRWKVQIRVGVIEEEVEATSLFTAAEEASRRYPQGEIVGVVEQT